MDTSCCSAWVRDAQFGPLIVVGLGGIYVEVLGDTAARLAPFGVAEWGRTPVDTEALAQTISRFSVLAAVTPELSEIEVNPLIAGARCATAVDVRARRLPR